MAVLGVLDTIIMFNGEICMIEKDSCFYKRLTNIYITKLNKNDEIDYENVIVYEKNKPIKEK